MGRSPSRQKNYLVKFGGHRECGSEVIMILVSYMILKDYIIKGSYDFRNRSSLKQITILSGLVAICTLIVEI